MTIRPSMFYVTTTCGSGYRATGRNCCGKRRLCAWLPSRGWMCRGCAGARRKAWTSKLHG